MNKENVLRVLRALPHCHKIKPSKTGFNFTCPLAPFLHDPDPRTGIRSDRHPSAGVTVNDTGYSGFKCFVQHEGSKGTFLSMLKLLADFEPSIAPLVVEVAELEIPDPDKVRVSVFKEAERMFTPAQAVQPKLNDEDLWPEHQIAKYVGKVPKWLMEERGITLETAAKFNVGFDESDWKHHLPWLILPVRRWPDGGLVGVTGRPLVDKATRDELGLPKYKHYNNFDKGRFFYGEHLLDFSGERKIVIIVEGHIDVQWLYQAKLPNPLAPMGTSLTDTQVRRLEQWGVDVCLMADGDLAGANFRDEAVRQLRGKMPLYVARCPEGKSPNNMPVEELWNSFSRAEYVL